MTTRQDKTTKRAESLKTNLRSNLQKRKNQARARNTPQAETSETPAKNPQEGQE